MQMPPTSATRQIRRRTASLRRERAGAAFSLPSISCLRVRRLRAAVLPALARMPGLGSAVGGVENSALLPGVEGGELSEPEEAEGSAAPPCQHFFSMAHSPTAAAAASSARRRSGRWGAAGPGASPAPAASSRAASMARRKKSARWESMLPPLQEILGDHLSFIQHDCGIITASLSSFHTSRTFVGATELRLPSSREFMRLVATLCSEQVLAAARP